MSKKRKKKTKEERIESLMQFLRRKAKGMRYKKTRWELILYKHLKDLGYKFKNQVPIICREKYGYIVDFLLTDYNIFIEADSKQFHGSKEQIKKDNLRTRRLKKEGYYPLRLTNSQISTLTKEQIQNIIELSISMYSVKS